MASDVEGPWGCPGPPLWTQAELFRPPRCEVTRSSEEIASPGETVAWKEIEPVLELWLRWNKDYEQLTELMYRQARDFHSLQLMADQLDQSRLKAVVSTEKLLKKFGGNKAS